MRELDIQFATHSYYLDLYLKIFINFSFKMITNKVLDMNFIWDFFRFSSDFFNLFRSHLLSSLFIRNNKRIRKLQELNYPESRKNITVKQFYAKPFRASVLS